MAAVRGLWRLLCALGHGLHGFWIIWRQFPALDEAARQAHVQRWSQHVLGVLGVTVSVHGDASRAGPLLLVCNHISWLDITVLHAVRHCRFVSKADVRQWPLIGMLATGAGTLYIERESRRDAMRVVHHMAERLRAGDVLAIFPEGTTSDGTGMLPFHANLLQSAVSADVRVQPLGLSFIDTTSGRTSTAPSYIGDETLVGSIWRTVTAPPVTAVVTFGEPQQANGRDRRQWSTDLHAEVMRLRERR